MLLQVRSARPAITLAGKDYYASLAPYFLNLSYSDNCDGEKADDLQLQLADRDGRFISDWMPDVGEFLDVSIMAERWFAPNAATLSLDCGRFWIDTVDFDLPQHTVSIKANSIPTTAHLKTVNETRGWEKSSLRDITEQIAGENKMDGVDWLAENNPRYARVEQQEESALQFLKKRANDAKLAIRVHRNKIVVYDEQKLEETAPQFTLTSGMPGVGGIASQLVGGAAAFLSQGSAGASSYRIATASFTKRVTDVQKGHKVKHASVKTGDTVTSEFRADVDFHPSGGSGNEALPDYLNNVSLSTDTEAEDEDSGESENGNGGSVRADTEPLPDWQNNTGGTMKAKADTRKSNKDKETADIQLGIGNPLVAAGMTFNLQGFGQFDGVWFVDSAEHTVGPEYTTKLKAHRCLKGY